MYLEHTYMKKRHIPISPLPPQTPNQKKSTNKTKRTTYPTNKKVFPCSRKEGKILKAKIRKSQWSTQVMTPQKNHTKWRESLRAIHRERMNIQTS